MASEPAARNPARNLEGELEEFHPDSFGWALACCGWNRDEAEEVLQTSYLKAIEGRAKFNGHSSSRTWFFGVVRKTAQERRKRAAVRLRALDRWLDRWLGRRPVAVSPPSPEEASDEGELRRRLQQTLGCLSTRQREMLHLVFYQDMTIEQASDVLHLSVGSARTHYQRGKARLRSLLSRGPGESK